jgi:uncharacterized RDD family membrane protein YckC
MVTPEAVVLDLPIASAGVRVIARAIDVVISLFGAFFVIEVIALFGSETVVIVVAAATGFAVLVGYPVLMEAFWGGRTLGKAVMKLRVVRADGAPIGLIQASARGALGLVDVWFTIGFVGLVSMLVSKRSQRLGDLVGGTLVLRRSRSSVRAVLPVHFAVPPGCEELVRTMDVGAMTPADYELVRSFLIRWHEFKAAQRPAVAATVAAPLWQRFRHPLPGWLGPDYYLACLGAAYQFRHPYNQASVAQPSPRGAAFDGGWGAASSQGSGPSQGGGPSWGTSPNWGANQPAGNAPAGPAAPSDWVAPR